MDLVSHDVLNINQAVLSAIELITESSRADEGAKRRVMKVESQIRISTQIFESMKLLCVMRKTGRTPSEPADLNKAARNAVSDTLTMFKDRQLGIELDESSEEAVVRGGVIARELLVNAMMGLLQLDNSERASITVGVNRADSEEGVSWIVSVKDENVSLPPSLSVEAIAAVPEDTRTKMVRLAGLILARMMAEKLGGVFEARPVGNGSELRIVLPGADLA